MRVPLLSFTNMMFFLLYKKLVYNLLIHKWYKLLTMTNNQQLTQFANLQQLTKNNLTTLNSFTLLPLRDKSSYQDSKLID